MFVGTKTKVPTPLQWKEKETEDGMVLFALVVADWALRDSNEVHYYICLTAGSCMRDFSARSSYEIIELETRKWSMQKLRVSFMSQSIRI